MGRFWGWMAATLLVALSVPTVAQAAYFPTGWNDDVTVDKDDVGMNFVVDFSGKANDNYTSNLSALGSFTYTGLSNNGLTYNFNYTLTNDSNYDSRIRAFGFDTGPSNPASVVGNSGFTYEYQNVGFIESVGTMDVCLAAGSGCTQHASGGINDGASMNGSFSLTFANVMESVDFDHFALKFISVNPTVNGQDWGAGLGRITSITPGAGSDPITAPEPETWMMMLLGFGLVGSAMRRRGSIALYPQVA
ncbi:cistern family PEP-CTERM protein [Sphingomonadaceae bacterium G21617-S1]|jgi:hypothetical protein|nr:cistern family PEP-CTERM protein [Sphingomonadaceae bacterium G21617-S1]